MTNLRNKFWLAGETIFDFRTGTESIATVCLLAPKHFKFFWCEAEDSCLSKQMPSILEVFASQELNIDFEINGPEKI